MAVAAVDLKPVLPQDAIAFFRAKGYFLQESFDWRDLDAESHAAAFTVAKSAGFDILGDIHQAVDDAIAQGTTLRQFEQRLTPVLQAKGWWGKKLVTDPLTGETKMAQLGSPRRLAIIFRTNLRMAYMAGRWQRIQRVKQYRPWLRYLAIHDDRTRPEHMRWDNVVRAVDDPFWETHYPPNGWNCRCDVQQLSDRDLARFGLKETPVPPPAMRRLVNRRTGEIMDVPKGIDPGFAHNVGMLARRAHAGKLLADGLAGLPPRIAARAHAAAAEFALPDIQRDFAAWVGAILDRKAGGRHHPDGESRIVGALSPAVLDELERRGLLPSTGAISVSSREVLHLLNDGKALDGKALDATDILRLPEIIARPIAILRDRRDGRLLYIFEPAVRDPRDGKVVVAVEYRGRLPSPNSSRSKGTINAVRSAGYVARDILTDPAFYEIIAGEV